MIHVTALRKDFKITKRAPGVFAAVKSMFHRRTETVRALNDVSFDIAKGEIVGYIGPNGAGKSTTIKIMSGILVPTSGECTVNGRVPWEKRRTHVREIGVVFGQRTQLWWDVPVIDSYQMLRDIYRLPQDVYQSSLDELTETLDLSGILQTPLRQLSLGQRMRCEIAGSLLHKPPLLFLDEPTIGLDATSKLAVRAFLKRINQERGVTVILTTHDMNDIEALTDRILLIGKGRLLYDGSLCAMRGQFEPKKTLEAVFTPNGEPSFSPPGATLLRWSDGRAAWELASEDVPRAISFLGERLTLTDVTARGASIEDVVARTYEVHGI